MKEKSSYSIKEASRISGVPQHVLRYWETEFPDLKPRKNLSGRREYRRMDVDLLLRIKHLLYNEQYTIAGAKKKLAGKKDIGENSESVKFLLKEISEGLSSIIKLVD